MSINDFDFGDGAGIDTIELYAAVRDIYPDPADELLLEEILDGDWSEEVFDELV